METDTKYEAYEVRTGQYGDGSVIYTLTRRILQSETSYGIIIEENVRGKALRAAAEDITRDRGEALEMLDLFYSERLDACHLADVLEEILPFTAYKRERERQEAENCF